LSTVRATGERGGKQSHDHRGHGNLTSMRHLGILLET
jgi:hypothetical protein